MRPVPTRIVFWNVPGYGWMYGLLGVLVAVFGWGVWRRVRRWRRGQPEPRWPDWRRQWRRRVGEAVRLAGLQAAVLRDASGLAHAVLYFSFLVLFLGTVVVFVHHDLHIPLMQGWFYLIFQSLGLDAAGLAGIASAGSMLLTRHVRRPPRLSASRIDVAMLWTLLLVLVTGFVVEGLRIGATRDPWGAWSPVGWLVARAFAAAGGGADLARRVHRIAWWLHMGMAFGWLGAVPFTRSFHALAGGFAAWARDPSAGTRLEPLDVEAAERLGAADLTDFTWKGLFDLDACTACGRCQDACPAWTVGRPLSPKALILDMQALLHGRIPGPLVDGAVAEEALWSCTTCRACMEACPVFIEHVPKIVAMRRHLVMESARFPEGMQEAVLSVETRGHPWRGTPFTRTDWSAGLDVRVLQPGDACDVLLWVGCTGALEPRNQRVVRALARLLRHAGVDFAVLGEAERCTGDPARRIGHEYLFQLQARANVETLARYRFRRIATACPHCLNTLRNEYPDFGGTYRVVHHSQLLAELVADGRLPGAARADDPVTFHDPCYLGRHNGEFAAPRSLLAAAGHRLAEMPRTGLRSFCCGAGGGRAFADEASGMRIQFVRAAEARATGAATVATACPFCLLMMEDGARAAAPDGEAPQAVRDVAEILADAVLGAEGAAGPAPGTSGRG